MQDIRNALHFRATRRAPIYGAGSQPVSMEQQQLPIIRSDVLQYLQANHPAEHAVWVTRIAKGETILEK